MGVPRPDASFKNASWCGIHGSSKSPFCSWSAAGPAHTAETTAAAGASGAGGGAGGGGQVNVMVAAPWSLLPNMSDTCPPPLGVYSSTARPVVGSCVTLTLPSAAPPTAVSVTLLPMLPSAARSTMDGA